MLRTFTWKGATLAEHGPARRHEQYQVHQHQWPARLHRISKNQGSSYLLCKTKTWDHEEKLAHLRNLHPTVWPSQAHSHKKITARHSLREQHTPTDAATTITSRIKTTTTSTTTKTIKTEKEQQHQQQQQQQQQQRQQQQQQKQQLKHNQENLFWIFRIITFKCKKSRP